MMLKLSKLEEAVPQKWRKSRARERFIILKIQIKAQLETITELGNVQIRSLYDASL